MIQSIRAEELSKFNDLLSDHLSELTEEMKTCTNSEINKILRVEVSNVTSMINGLFKHKLFASCYEDLTGKMIVLMMNQYSPKREHRTIQSKLRK